MSTEYRRGERHVYRFVAGEHLLIALHRDAVAPMFAFTPTAAALWDRMAGWTTRAALVEALCARYDVTAEEAERDVEEFLRQLAEIDAVESREAAA
jgi:hypothetical protein